MSSYNVRWDICNETGAPRGFACSKSSTASQGDCWWRSEPGPPGSGVDQPSPALNSSFYSLNLVQCVPGAGLHGSLIPHHLPTDMRRYHAPCLASLHIDQ
jgi:hypothetical protein